MSLRTRTARAALLSLLATTAAAQTQPLVLRGATLIDGTERPAQADVTVVLRNGWIVAAGRRAEVPGPRGARVVDLGGKYLLPGLIEMHGHLAIGAWELDRSKGKPVLHYAYDEVATRELTRSQLAFGITTVRNPAAPTREAVVLRNRVRFGEQVGPRIVTSGAPLDSPSINDATDPVSTPDEARAAVDRQAAAGVDFIKLYSGLEPPVLRAAIDEAHRLGLTAVGHLWRTSWTEAAEAGIDGITHIIVNHSALLPAERRTEYEKGIHGGQFMFDWFKYADFDGPEIKAMIEALLAHHVTIDPTLIAFEDTAWFDDSTHYPADAARYVPPTFAVKWKAMNDLRGWSPADYVSARQQFPRMQELARRLHQAGVTLTAGTDVANPWMYHHELELLAAAGIPTADVIRIATRNGALGLGRIAEFGTVEVGKRADLVVLDADPIADIRNTRRIAWVVHDGTLARPDAYLPERLRARQP